MEYDVTTWQQGLRDDGVPSEVGLASYLFEASTTAFAALLQVLTADTARFDAELYESLREEFKKYYIWNEGFSTASGDLDDILACSKNLKATVLRLMVQWARAACRVPVVMSTYDWAPASVKISELLERAQTVGQVADAVGDEVKIRHATIPDDANDSESDTNSESDSDLYLRDDTFEDIVEDLRVFVESLVDLTPSLENPANDTIMVEESLVQSDDLSSVNESARPFALIIKDRFPSTDINLVKKLGEINWHRRQRLRDKLAAAPPMSGISSSDSQQSSDRDTVMPISQRGDFIDRNTDSSTVRASTDVSSAYQTVTTSNYSESSIFDRNSMVPTRRSIAESVTSFVTSVAEGIDDGQRRIPTLPDDHDFESPFQCQICGDVLRNIRNRVDWKKHVYDDLEPYVCLFSNCSLGLHTFQSRRTWIMHEFQMHRIDTKWPCNMCKESFASTESLQSHIESTHKQAFAFSQVEQLITASKRNIVRSAETEICPFCLTYPARTQKVFASHVGRHLQEISLSALPRIDLLSGNNSDDDDDVHDSSDDGTYNTSMNDDIKRKLYYESSVGSSGHESNLESTTKQYTRTYNEPVSGSGAVTVKSAERGAASQANVQSPSKAQELDDDDLVRTPQDRRQDTLVTTRFERTSTTADLGGELGPSLSTQAVVPLRESSPTKVDYSDESRRKLSPASKSKASSAGEAIPTSSTEKRKSSRFLSRLFSPSPSAANLKISAPANPLHGLPKEWTEIISTTYPSTSGPVENPETLRDIIEFYKENSEPPPYPNIEQFAAPSESRTTQVVLLSKVRKLQRVLPETVRILDNLIAGDLTEDQIIGLKTGLAIHSSQVDYIESILDFMSIFDRSIIGDILNLSIGYITNILTLLQPLASTDESERSSLLSTTPQGSISGASVHSLLSSAHTLTRPELEKQEKAKHQARMVMAVFEQLQQVVTDMEVNLAKSKEKEAQRKKPLPPIPVDVATSSLTAKADDSFKSDYPFPTRSNLLL
ncbi:hypothetical protein B7494_g6698 [Chlorociboria aeruginascens]|nr:hypothetical protein B7494_g6698 [Chlorociboria aeruginascens]